MNIWCASRWMWLLSVFVVARQNTFKNLPLRWSVANKKCGNNKTEQKMWQQYDRSKSVATIGPRTKSVAKIGPFKKCGNNRTRTFRMLECWNMIKSKSTYHGSKHLSNVLGFSWQPEFKDASPRFKIYLSRFKMLGCWKVVKSKFAYNGSNTFQTYWFYPGKPSLRTRALVSKFTDRDSKC